MAGQPAEVGMTGQLLLHNLNEAVVTGFGDEWSRFDQTGLTPTDLEYAWEAYFEHFPWALVRPDAKAFDLGCGSGRWARLIAPLVGELWCIDASAKALAVAARNTRELSNVRLVHACVDGIPVGDEYFDFGYCLGVLHHLPDPQAGMTAAVAKLKRGAPFLVSLYYSFESRPAWFRWTWKASELIRFVVSRSPLGLRYLLSQVCAALIYWPLARSARLAERFGADVPAWPLSAYRNLSFYTMRTDALDRFGTRLEHRFTRTEVRVMMERGGLRDIEFSVGPAYWVAHGVRREK